MQQREGAAFRLYTVDPIGLRRRESSVRERRDPVWLWDADGFALEPLGFDPRALASSRKLRRNTGSDIPRYAVKSSIASRRPNSSV